MTQGEISSYIHNFTADFSSSASPRSDMPAAAITVQGTAEYKTRFHFARATENDSGRNLVLYSPVPCSLCEQRFFVLLIRRPPNSTLVTCTTLFRFSFRSRHGK